MSVCYNHNLNAKTSVTTSLSRYLEDLAFILHAV